MTAIDYNIVELDGLRYPVLAVTGSVSIGITRYFRPASAPEIFGRFNETPIPDAIPVRVHKRLGDNVFVVRRVPERTRAP